MMMEDTTDQEMRQRITQTLLGEFEKINENLKVIEQEIGLAVQWMKDTGDTWKIEQMAGMLHHLVEAQFNATALVSHWTGLGLCKVAECSDTWAVMHLRRIPYNEYLQSPWWRSRRQRALELSGDRCQVCNSTGPLDVHHRTYERRGEEADGDLFVLCRGCHDIFHENGKLAR
jgi:hypothetical protein